MNLRKENEINELPNTLIINQTLEEYLENPEKCKKDKITAALSNGKIISIPTSRFRRLKEASLEQLQNFEIAEDVKYGNENYYKKARELVTNHPDSIDNYLVKNLGSGSLYDIEKRMKLTDQQYEDLLVQIEKKILLTNEKEKIGFMYFAHKLYEKFKYIPYRESEKVFYQELFTEMRDSFEKMKKDGKLDEIYNEYNKKKATQRNIEIKTRYIGSTKKTCARCQAVINIFNDGKFEWEVYGTHGNQANLGHTTSEIPEQLSNPVQLLEELQKLEELQAQIEVSSKTETG
ncbi:14628_t:CDS:2, partial [Gigaspora margarita]